MPRFNPEGGGIGFDPFGGESAEPSAPPGSGGLIDRTIGATLIGARRDPFVSFAINQLTDALPGVQRKDLDELERGISNSRLADVFEVVGRVAAFIGPGIGAFAAGRVAGRAGLTALARVAPSARGGQLARVAARAADRAGGVPIAKPAIERVAEIVGGAAGIGGLEGTTSLIEGAPLPQAAKEAAVGAALTAGFETGFTVAAKRLFPTAREVKDVGKIEERARKAGAFDVIQEARVKSHERIASLSSRIQEILGTDQQHGELLKLGPFEAVVRGRQRATPEQLSAIRTLGRKIKQERSILKAAELFEETKVPKTWYTSDVPLGDRGVLGSFGKSVAVKLFRSPETALRNQGEMANRLGIALRDANIEVAIGRAALDGKISSLKSRAVKAMGARGRSVRDGSFIRPISTAYERGGLEGVRQAARAAGRTSRQTEELVGVFDEMGEITRLYGQLAEMGALPKLTPQQLSRMGLSHYLPHVLRPMKETELRGKLVQFFQKQGLNEAQALGRADDILASQYRSGLAKFGSIDHMRVIPGTLQSKLDAGLPFLEDPFESLARYAFQLQRRLSFGKRFGFNGELADSIVASVRREGGSEALARTILDEALFAKLPDHALRSLSRTVAGFQAGSKLALAVIPNVSQVINTLLFAGFRNTVQGGLRALRRENLDDVVSATALMESLYQQMGRVVDDQLSVNLADKFARGVFRFSLFDWVERWNRLVAGAAGLYTLRHTLAQASRGRLRGRSLDIARRRLAQLGVDLDDAVRNIRANGAWVPEAGTLERAIFLAAQTTQFIPSVTRRPLWWNHPVGRVVFQFKNFAFNQTKFLRDMVVAEAARGNMKPMAYFLSLYPVAGEAVRDVRSLVRLEPRDSHGVERVLEDYLAVGGMGLATDMLVQARFGRLSNFILGPTISDLLDFSEAMVQPSAERVRRQVVRQPLFTATRTLMAAPILTGAVIDEYLDVVPSDTREDESPPTLESFRQGVSR